jgi:hypothetical protein
MSSRRLVNRDTRAPRAVGAIRQRCAGHVDRHRDMQYVAAIAGIAIEPDSSSDACSPADNNDSGTHHRVRFVRA